MSAGFSSDDQSALTFPEGRTQTTLKSNLPFFSESSEVDKDNLIDEMQEKFGELLDANQQLGNARKHIDGLKQKMSLQEKTWKAEKDQFQTDIRNLNNELNEDRATIDKLQKEVKDLQERLTEKEQEHTKLKEEMAQNQEMSRAEIRDSLANQKKEFQVIIDKKEKELGDLHKQVLDLKAENMTNNDSMIKKHLELEKLTVDKGRLENQFKRLESEKIEADERAASLRQLIHKMKEEKEQLANKISEDERLIDQMKNEIIALKRTIERQKDDAEELNEKLTAVQEILPEYTEFNKLIDELHDRVELAETLPIELKKTKKQLAKALKALGLTRTQAEEAGYQIGQLQESSSLLQQQNEELQAENEKVVAKYKFVLSMQGNVKTIEAANREFSHRMDLINATLKGTAVMPTLRTIIITTIILKRWKKLPGVPRKFENDSRNWWWICGNEDQIRKKEEPIKMIKDLLTVKQRLMKKIEGLTNIIHDAEKTHENNERAIKEKTTLLETEQTHVAYLQDRVSQLEDKISKMIDANTHATLSEKYDNVKKKLMETSSALAKSSDEMVMLQHEVTMLRQKEQSANNFKKSTDKNTQELRDKIQEQEEEIIMLRQALSTKNREITTLERATNRIKPAYLTIAGDDKPTRGNRHSTEISINTTSSVSSTNNLNRPLQERLLAMSRNIN